MDTTTLNKWKKRNNLRKIEYKGLLKALKSYQNNNSKNNVLLEYRSNVRPLIERGLIKPNSKEINKALNWYDLTDKGENIINNIYL